MVIDANIFKGYFQLQIGKSHSLCGCPKKLFTCVTSYKPVFYDDIGIIEHEWRNVVDKDWFDAWLAASLSSGTIKYITAIKNQSIEKQLRSNGFPNGRDIVYVRVSIAVANDNNRCDFFTEDIDFYDPKLKGCRAATRQRLLTTSGGPIPKVLAKHRVKVQCAP